jgi:YggT family protein
MQQILERILWFLTSAVSVVIVAVIVLMFIRLIVERMDLNPFAWTSRTVRRLSDPFVIPMRAGLRGFGGMNPDYAPLVVILITILLGFFVLSLLRTIVLVIAGVVDAVQSGAMFMALGYIIYGLLSIYSLFILVRIVFSWGRVSYSNRIMRFLVDVTEPLLGPLRRMIPLLGWLDISPIVAFFIIWLLQRAIEGTLLTGARFGAL